MLTNSGIMTGMTDPIPHLIALLSPQPIWRVLALTVQEAGSVLALAPHVAQVVIGSSAHSTLIALQKQMAERGLTNVALFQHDAECLPCASAAFEAVICHHTAHRLRNAAAFVAECARVLRHGGLLALADCMVSGEPHIARFVNTLERLRSPAHVWAYSPEDWEAFLASTGLTVIHRETHSVERDFDEWAAAADVQGEDLLRLRALLVQAPQAPRAWLAPRVVGSRLVFTCTEGLLIGRKA